MNANRTPEQIEADIEDVRQRMDSTLDELEHRLNARRIVRDGLSQLAHAEIVRQAASAAAGARRTARDNPVPTALAGASLLGLMALGLRARKHARHAPPRKGLGVAVSEAVDSARERLSGARGSLADSAHNARRRMRAAGGDAWHRVEHIGSEAHSMVRSHPVAVTAMGLAVLALAAVAATPALRDRISGR